MKIAIITLHRVFNYGSVLQAYATYKTFKKTGNDVVLIDYITEQRTLRRLLVRTPNNISYPITNVLYMIMKSCSIIVKYLIFNGFIKRHINLTDRRYVSFEDLKNDLPKADVYVTGSDQVWNSHYNEGIDKGFFLEFAPKGCKRIAYASSFGKENLDETEIEETKGLIQKYTAISVREDTALEILNGLGYENARWLLDPTLQLKKEEWLAIAKPNEMKDKYLLLMMLYNEDEGGTEFAKTIAKQRNLKLVKISWGYKKPPEVDLLKTHKSPEKFLSLAYHADYIVTNSFHGLAFAINFNKPFIVIPRKEFNTRIESLLRLTGLEHRMLGAGFDQNIVDQQIDYLPINALLDKERKKAMDFILTECL
jgi:hypothetical protein